MGSFCRDHHLSPWPVSKGSVLKTRDHDPLVSYLPRPVLTLSGAVGAPDSTG